MRILTGIFALGLAGSILAQAATNDSIPTAGVDLYMRYCAVCHGRDAKGAGPAAAALKSPPADLTRLTKSHAGKFPVGTVRQLLGGGSSTPAHGSQEMPMWGPVFRAMSPNESIAKLRVDNLLRYLESIQEK